MLRAHLARVLHGEVKTVLVTADDLVLRAVVHEHAPDVLHQRYGKKIADKNRKHYRRFAEAEQRGMIVGAGYLEDKPREKIGQKHEKPYRKCKPQHQRNRRQNVHGIELELLRHPFVELRGFGIVAEHFGGAHQHAHSHEELAHEVHHSPYEGQAENDAALPGVGNALRLDGDLPGFRAHGGSHRGAPFHHDALYHRLPSYGSAAHRLTGFLLFFRFIRAVGAL